VGKTAPVFCTLCQEFGVNLEYPPTHITIFTLQKDKGIFLVSKDDIQKMAKPIEADELYGVINEG